MLVNNPVVHVYYISIFMYVASEITNISPNAHLRKVGKCKQVKRKQNEKKTSNLIKYKKANRHPNETRKSNTLTKQANHTNTNKQTKQSD